MRKPINAMPRYTRHETACILMQAHIALTQHQSENPHFEELARANAGAAAILLVSAAKKGNVKKS